MGNSYGILMDLTVDLCKTEENVKSSGRLNLLDGESNVITGQVESYLCLDAVEATAPKHMAPPQLHLSVVDLIQVLHLLQLILRDLLLLRAVTRCLQELQPASGDTGHQLRRWTDTNIGSNI